MKNLRNTEVAKYRLYTQHVLTMYGSFGDDTCGVFLIPLSKGEVIQVIASSGQGWDHVSVSLSNRAPTWAEMDMVKRWFFEDDETAVQFHVPVKEHINMHEYTLHLWRSLEKDFPRPPANMV